MSDGQRAQRLAEIRRAHEAAEQGGDAVAGAHADRGWLLAELTAANEALASFAYPDDGTSLAERITLLGKARGAAMYVARRLRDSRNALRERLPVVRKQAHEEGVHAARANDDPTGVWARLDVLASKVVAVGEQLDSAPPTLTASLPDLGLVEASGATPQALAEDVASQLAHVWREYAVTTDPLDGKAMELRERVRAFFAGPVAAEKGPML